MGWSFQGERGGVTLRVAGERRGTSFKAISLNLTTSGPNLQTSKESTRCPKESTRWRRRVLYPTAYTLLPPLSLNAASPLPSLLRLTTRWQCGEGARRRVIIARES
jgi:hypothetical protein